MFFRFQEVKPEFYPIYSAVSHRSSFCALIRSKLRTKATKWNYFPIAVEKSHMEFRIFGHVVTTDQEEARIKWACGTLGLPDRFPGLGCFPRSGFAGQVLLGRRAERNGRSSFGLMFIDASIDCRSVDIGCPGGR